MSQKYQIEVWEVFQNRCVIVFRWAAQGIGFGELVIDSHTHEIIDDEYMGCEFANQVMEIGFREYGEYLKNV